MACWSEAQRVIRTASHSLLALPSCFGFVLSLCAEVGPGSCRSLGKESRPLPRPPKARGSLRGSWIQCSDWPRLSHGPFLHSGLETKPLEMHGHWMGTGDVILQMKICISFPGNEWVSTVEILLLSLFSDVQRSGRVSRSHREVVMSRSKTQGHQTQHPVPFVQLHLWPWWQWHAGHSKGEQHTGARPAWLRSAPS